MGTILPDPGMGQISEHLIKYLQEQLLRVTLQRQPKLAPLSYLQLHIKASIWLDLACRFKTEAE